MEPEAPWAVRLAARIRRIQDRALSPGLFQFSVPMIRHQEKDRAKGEFRPIAVFQVDDKIIDSLTARYFRNCLDPALRDSCFAFRCSNPGKPAPQFHDAFEKILRLRRRHVRTGLFVAECDIKGFFDCVAHNVALASLEALIEDAKKLSPSLTIDQRGIGIFRAFLNCYSFPQNVRIRAEPALKRATGNTNAHYKWPESELAQFHQNVNDARIGVPQGGALSCLIANCVLHVADKTLSRLQRRLKPTFTYIRYCDDMIILSPDKASCECAFAAYQECLRSLYLPIHPAKAVSSYSRAFWDGKTNSPYHWGRDRGMGDVPWIQFVGYQVRADGLVRVRKKSLKKQFRKLTRTADDLIRHIARESQQSGVDPHVASRVRKSRRSILYRFRQKLISMSVGRRKLHDGVNCPQTMSWTFGYRALRGKLFPKAMLRSLDRHVERQIRRVKRRLDQMRITQVGKQETKVRIPDYFGSPFSYSGQFNNKDLRGKKPNRPNRSGRG